MSNRAQRNNNPGNLRFAKQKESSGKDDEGFAQFPTPMAGWRALHNQLKLDQSRNITLEEFVNKYAPPNENDSERYLNFLASGIRCEPDTPLLQLSRYALGGLIAGMEGYYNT